MISFDSQNNVYKFCLKTYKFCLKVISFFQQGNIQFWEIFRVKTLFQKLWPLLYKRAKLDLRSTKLCYANTFCFPPIQTFTFYLFSQHIRASYLKMATFKNVRMSTSKKLDKTGPTNFTNYTFEISDQVVITQWLAWRLATRVVLSSNPSKGENLLISDLIVL